MVTDRVTYNFLETAAKKSNLAEIYWQNLKFNKKIQIFKIKLRHYKTNCRGHNANGQSGILLLGNSCKKMILQKYIDKIVKLDKKNPSSSERWNLLCKNKACRHINIILRYFRYKKLKRIAKICEFLGWMRWC